MGKIFKNQTALRIEVNCGIDLSTTSEIFILFRKPDGSTGQFTATIDNIHKGIVYYDLQAGNNELDQAGEWCFWIKAIFNDGRTAEGERTSVDIFDNVC